MSSAAEIQSAYLILLEDAELEIARIDALRERVRRLAANFAAVSRRLETQAGRKDAARKTAGVRIKLRLADQTLEGKAAALRTNCDYYEARMRKWQESLDA